MMLEIIFVIVYCIAFVFNVMGNSIVIYIICQKRKTSTDYLLLNMAFADLVYGVFVVIFLLALSSSWFAPKYYHIVVESEVFCHVFTSGNIAWVAFVDSILTMLVLSVERYFAVCRPYSFKECFSTRNVKLIVVVSWVLSVAIIAPRNSGQSCSSPRGDTAKVVSVISVVLSIATLVVLIVLSVKIYVSLWCKHSTIQPSEIKEIKEKKKKKKVTLCVLAVTVTYIVCSLPQFISNVLRVFRMPGTEEEVIMVQITLLLTFINSALDPYLFSFQNKRMRMLSKKIFMCKSNSQPQVPAPEQQVP
ncbi:histamine H2 receptor-like [Exaiptasia diaphana]|uniref:G-protein coupled receptors family 1 profile domain-containing protein n=1 Tax=Exaiptasia diaphana TaxID=2652724 RepID=A0A913X0C7_EXADI|nr:histamine H2 receptor-like [Exaiptasia diaphana]